MNDTKAITFNRLPILGKPKVAFEEWKYSYERWCKSNNVNEDEKLECLISVTEGIARTIVINALNKDQPDNYDTTINKLRNHYKSSLPKNSRLLELSTITIKKGESVSEFNTKFDTLLNNVIISYYINAFRSFPRTYEALLEGEPKKLEEAMELATKKENIYTLIGTNRHSNKFSQNNQRRNYNENSFNGRYYAGNQNNLNRNNISNSNSSRSYQMNNNYNNRPNQNNYTKSNTSIIKMLNIEEIQ